MSNDNAQNQAQSKQNLAPVEPARSGTGSGTSSGKMPSVDRLSGGPVQGTAVDPDTARKNIEGRQLPTNILDLSQLAAPVAVKSFASGTASGLVGAPASIVELARGLKNDPDLIAEYVTTQVDTLPLYGLQKGGLGAALDQRGSAFDLADLMVQLLRQAGLTANFMFGDLRLTLAQAAARFGTSTTDIWAANNLLANGGIPVAVTNVSGTDYLDFSHCWVQVNIGGTFYVFDPANKSYTTQAGIANLATAMGYNAATFLTSAKVGATTTADYVQNMNRTNIRNNLTTMTTSLVNWIKANNPAASVDDIVGGKTINGITLGASLTSLPYQKPGSTPTVWTAIPAAYKATLGILYDNFNLTVNAADIYGKRLTMFFNASHQCELRLNGTVLATSSAQSPGSWNSVLLTATHPYPTTYANQSRWMRIYADQYYAIANGWGNASSRLRDIHTTQFYVNKATGAAATSETVLGAQLTAFYAAQNAENSRVTELVNKMTNCVTVFHHQLGLVGDVGAPMIDIGMFSGSTSALDNNYNRVQWNDTAGAIHGVMLEATAIQENTGPVGVSTVTIIDLASQAGKKIFDGKTANWLTNVKPNLVGWDPAVVTDIENYYINSGWRVALPENGVTTLNLFSGYGYWALPTYGAFGVLGGTKGGLGSNVRNNVPPMVPIDGQSAGANSVTLRDGNFSFTKTDLSVGSQSVPYGLAFSRTYNAANSFVDNGLGLGWSHNFAVSAKSGHATLLSLGDQSPIAGAASIVQLFVAADLLSDLARPHDKFVTASLGGQWLADNVLNNVVNIVTATSNDQFVRLPDGTYVNPFRMADSLTLSGGIYTYKSPQKVTCNFNTDGTIASMVYPFGVTWTFTYTTGKLTSVSNGMGRQINLVYSGAKLASLNDGNGRSVTFTIDASKNLTTVSDPLGKNQTYSYVTPGLLFKAFAPANPASPLFTNTFDSLGQLKQQADSYANVTTMYYAGYRTETVDAASNKTITYQNRYGDVTKVVNHLGGITTNVFDSRRRLKQVTLAEGNGHQYTYDGNDNVLTATAFKKPGSPLGNLTVTKTYDPLWNKVKTIVDNLGRTTTYNYNAVTGNLESVVHPTVAGSGTPQVTLTCNSRGQLLTFTDATGIVSKNTYDTVTEKMTSTVHDFGTGRLNLTTNFGYNSVGDVTSIQDPRGNTLTYQFDSNRRVKQKTAPAPFSYVTKLTYDDNGNVVKTERQTNDVVNPWQTQEATYAIDNKILTTKSASGFISSYAYTNLRQLWKTTDPLSRVTELAYDALGRLYTVKDPSLTINYTRTYTPNGQVLSLKDVRNNSTTYTYDGHDRPLRTTYPNASYTEVQSYDLNSNPLVVRTRAGNTITMTYDELNRLKTKAPSGQPTVTYASDLANRLVSVSKPVVSGDPSSGTFTKGYDTAGRLILEQYPDGKQFTHQLDANGSITRTTWPDSWFCDRVFDQMNRITDIKLNGAVSSAIQYQYDALSRRKKVILENGTSTDYVRELDDDLSSIAQTFVGSNVTFSMGYNNNSEVTSKQISDNLFSWHPTSAGTTTYATANTINQYPTVGGTSYSYNGDACLTSDGVWTYSYSTENQLLTANKTGVSVAFKYDPYGRQVEKAVGAVKTRFYYAGQRRLGDYDSSGALQKRYIYAPDLDEVAIQIDSAGVKTYCHSDNLGSVIATTNSAGAILNRYTYGPFGETPSLTGITHGYTGQRYDSETGLYSYKSRFYSPQIGRFLQPDGLGYSSGSNLYSYVGNSPTGSTDPMGFKPYSFTSDSVQGDLHWVYENIHEDISFIEFVNRVWPGHLWDPKKDYMWPSADWQRTETTGNINFGAAGRKLGLDRNFLHFGAGLAQIGVQIVQNKDTIVNWAFGPTHQWKPTISFHWQWIFTSWGDAPEDAINTEIGYRLADQILSQEARANAMGLNGNSGPTGPGGGSSGGGGGGSGPLYQPMGTDIDTPPPPNVSSEVTSRDVHAEIRDYGNYNLGGDKATAGTLKPEELLTGRLVPRKPIQNAKGSIGS
jgi:RHS repeat-associated protein